MVPVMVEFAKRSLPADGPWETAANLAMARASLTRRQGPASHPAAWSAVIVVSTDPGF